MSNGQNHESDVFAILVSFRMIYPGRSLCSKVNCFWFSNYQTVIHTKIWNHYMHTGTYIKKKLNET